MSYIINGSPIKLALSDSQIEGSFVFPASFSQQRLWFLCRLAPASSFYTIAQSILAVGDLNLEVLERSLREIIRRHEVLRTVFAEVDGEPVQVILPSLHIDLPIISLESLVEKDWELEVQRLATEEALRPFDLAQGPLLRFSVLSYSHTQTYVFLFSIHHIIADGWSITVFWKEIEQLYRAYIANHPVPLLELPIQYADFTLWQRQVLESEIGKKQLNYWKQQLQGLPLLLELPTDRPRPAVQTFSGAAYPFALASTTTHALKVLSRQEQSTLFMTLLSVFQILLARYSGQVDFAVGTPIANRQQEALEALIGFFVNTVVLRANLSENISFREYLAHVREVVLESYANPDLPFEKLVEELQPARSLSYNPLFQVMFVLQNTQETRQWGQLTETMTWKILPIESPTAKFDLTLIMWEDAGELRGSWEYNKNLFEATTIKRLAGHFQLLLAAVIAQPQQPVWELPILTEQEQQQILGDWNVAEVEPLQGRCIYEWIEAQVELHPDAIAVVQDDQMLTYQALNQRANQLGFYLQARGVGPDVLIGLFMEYSLEMIIGILGILKAGGAYVPLDPSSPRNRLAFILRNTQMQLLLIQQHLKERLPSGAVPLLCLDTNWPQMVHLSIENGAQRVNSANLAYVIYTSGSTGKPKGVSITHGNLMHSTYARIIHYKEPVHTFLLLSSIAFDSSVAGIFWTFCQGGTLLVPSKNIQQNLLEAIHLIGRHAVSHILCVPSLYVNMLAYTDVQTFVSLHGVIVAGESCPKTLVEQHKKLLPFTSLFNEYGPTEGTVWSSVYNCLAYQEGHRIPIGHSIINTQILVLDTHLQIVPIGVPGELYIGGAGIARGYLHQPALTAQRFIPHPFDGMPGTRLYKTGDIGRYLPEGIIEFLGRNDRQVKIHGFRIELGEIEEVLLGASEVQEAVVVATEVGADEKRIVAYIVAPSEEDTARRIDLLRAYLGKILPAYMLPFAFVFLDAIPRTYNGKIDYLALPSHFGQDNIGETFAPPRDQLEQLLADLWTEVLRIPRVGAHDNFFALGGHSLAAVQLISRIRNSFHREIPLPRIFETPTIAGLAEYLHATWENMEGDMLPPLCAVPRNLNLPLSFAQQRLWFLDQLQPNSPFYNISAALQIQGPLDMKTLVHSFNEIVRRHEALRTTFQTIDGQASQVIIPLLYLTPSLIDLCDLPENERNRQVFQLAEEERYLLFDLTSGPLLRLRVLRVARDTHILCISTHHIVSDGWSMSVLMQELTVLYMAFFQKRPSPLSELPIQYADFAFWQRQHLQGHVLENMLSYWKQRLRNFPPFLTLPADHPRPLIKTFQGAIHFFTLSGELSEALRSLSRQEGVTLFMTLLAAFQILLHRYTGQTDIVVGTPVANRNHTELEKLIGFLVNTLALRIDLSGNPDVREVLRRVREMALGAYLHQDLPFEQLVEELHPVRDLSHEPLFEIMFALQNDAWSSVKIGELTLNPLEIENRSAKFDLSLTFGDDAYTLTGGIEYNTNLFEATTIARMANHLQIVLEKIVANPDASLANLSLLTAVDYQQMLVEWNTTQMIYSTDGCLHQLFEAQVRRTPAAIALIFEDEKVTYQELNEQANRLAHFLQQEGVGPEMLVGLCVERSIEAVVGLLAILKAGGAYVPLDPSYPLDRLAFMLSDCQASFVLTQHCLQERLPTAGIRLLCLDTDATFFSQQPTSNPPSTVRPDQLAYVIYTSGSTGHPKGVLGLHSSICNRLLWGQHDVKLQPSDRTLQVASLSFDISIWELFSSWLVGASVVLAHHEGYQERSYLTSLITQQHITVIHAVPSLLRLLVEETALALCTSLRCLLCGGELLPVDLVRRFQACLPIEVHHFYGPTEAAISSTSWICQPGVKVDILPLGRPIANTSVYLLDQYGLPVPVNVPGELYIGGAAVVRGYLRRSDLTAERFVPHPFSTEAGERLYRTGDLARYLPDGNLEFLGRNDQQIKIRGFRIEPGEIETMLTRHFAIRQVIVLAREIIQNEKCLVAYFVPSANHAPTSSELHTYLKERLPDYMIPSLFISMKEIPINTNGKIDQSLLPLPNRVVPALQVTYRAPRDALELQLVQIFESILGLHPVGVTDNFFELGGHSLLAVRLMAHIQKATGQNLPLSVLFQGATIEHLVSRLHQQYGAKPPSPLVALQADGSKTPFFCVHPIGGEVFCYLDLSRLLGRDQPFYGLQAPGLEENDDGTISLEELAAHYIETIQTVQAEGPYILSGWSFGALVAFEMARQLQQRGQEIKLLALLDPPVPQLHHQYQDGDDASIVTMFAKELEGRFGRNLSVRSEKELRDYTPNERLDYALMLAREVNMVPQNAGLSQVRHLLQVFRTNIRAMFNYVPQIYSGQITLFCAREVFAESYQDAAIGWNNVSTEDIAFHLLPGNHFTLLQESNVQELAEKLLTYLISS